MYELDQILNIEKESLKFYQEQFKFAENDKPLTYYFVKHENLSKNIKTGIKSI